LIPRGVEDLRIAVTRGKIINVPIRNDTIAYRRRLPHLSKRDKTYFVTFCTRRRFVLPPRVRDEVLASCVHDHMKRCWIHCAVVMPDHVHLLATPYDETILRIVSSIKGASAYKVNRLLDRQGPLWQQESFDRIVRRDEDLNAKADYILRNPVRAGLSHSCEDYPWFWRAATG